MQFKRDDQCNASACKKAQPLQAAQASREKLSSAQGSKVCTEVGLAMK